MTFDSITIEELKALALKELGIARARVAHFGDRRRRSTWIDAIQATFDEGDRHQRVSRIAHH